jgi:AraC family transcriptional regulator
LDHPGTSARETSVEEAEKVERECDMDVEVAVPILKRGKETDEITCYELPGAKMAKIMLNCP